jgi:lysosomal acid lipase/cholesteryl ester hydrolase
MAKFDLPAAFSNIAKITGQKIHYIGHSQGTLIMFIALSERNPTV